MDPIAKPSVFRNRIVKHAGKINANIPMIHRRDARRKESDKVKNLFPFLQA